MKKVLFAAAFLIGLAGASFAAAPVQLSLWNKTAVPKDDAVHGLEIGIGGNLSELKGVQWNLVISETQNGLGLQSGLVSKITGEFTGFQTGFVHLNKGSLKGAELGFANFNDRVRGASFGFVNYARELTGFQLGFFNYAHSSGSFALQIGLVNYLGDSSIFQWFPLANAKF